jgi:hypothetical protein
MSDFSPCSIRTGQLHLGQSDFSGLDDYFKAYRHWYYWIKRGVTSARKPSPAGDVPFDLETGLEIPNYDGELLNVAKTDWTSGGFEYDVDVEGNVNHHGLTRRIYTDLPIPDAIVTDTGGRGSAWTPFGCDPTGNTASTINDSDYGGFNVTKETTKLDNLQDWCNCVCGHHQDTEVLGDADVNDAFQECCGNAAGKAWNRNDLGVLTTYEDSPGTTASGCLGDQQEMQAAATCDVDAQLHLIFSTPNEGATSTCHIIESKDITVEGCEFATNSPWATPDENGFQGSSNSGTFNLDGNAGLEGLHEIFDEVIARNDFCKFSIIGGAPGWDPCAGSLDWRVNWTGAIWG